MNEYICLSLKVIQVIFCITHKLLSSSTTLRLRWYLILPYCDVLSNEINNKIVIKFIYFRCNIFLSYSVAQLDRALATEMYVGSSNPAGDFSNIHISKQLNCVFYGQIMQNLRF